MSTSLKIILDDFTDFHDMHRLRRDAHGVYTLVFDGRWVVNVESDPISNIVSIFAAIGHLQPRFDRVAGAAEVQWQDIEAEHLLFGGRIGVHFPTGTVMLDSTADPAQLDTVAFRQWLQNFVEQLALWASRLSPRLRGESLLAQGRSAPTSALTAGQHPTPSHFKSRGQQA